MFRLVIQTPNEKKISYLRIQTNGRIILKGDAFPPEFIKSVLSIGSFDIATNSAKVNGLRDSSIFLIPNPKGSIHIVKTTSAPNIALKTFLLSNHLQFPAQVEVEIIEYQKQLVIRLKTLPSLAIGSTAEKTPPQHEDDDDAAATVSDAKQIAQKNLANKRAKAKPKKTTPLKKNIQYAKNSTLMGKKRGRKPGTKNAVKKK